MDLKAYYYFTALLLFEERTSFTAETTPGIGWIGEI